MKPPRPRVTIRGVLVALGLFGAVLGTSLLTGRSREISARNECADHLRQIGLAVLNYASYRDAFPSGTLINPSLPPDQRLSWWAFVGNFIQQGLDFLLDRDESWNGGANRVPMFRLWSTDGNPPPYTKPAGDFRLVQCPGRLHPAIPAGACETDYVGIAGIGADAPTLALGHSRSGMFGYDRQTRPADIKDGAGNTMLIAETSSANGPWTRGGPSTVRGLDPARKPYIGLRRQFGGIHRGGVNVVFADGSVRFIRDVIEPEVFEALSTIAGGERLPPGWDR